VASIGRRETCGQTEFEVIEVAWPNDAIGGNASETERAVPIRRLRQSVHRFRVACWQRPEKQEYIRVAPVAKARLLIGHARLPGNDSFSTTGTGAAARQRFNLLNEAKENRQSE
jgi:hypothetical protein